MKGAIIVGILLLALGWFANDVYSISVTQPAVFVSKELISPGDRIKDSQILVYDDQIVIKLDGANWTRYTDTNSMDPYLDVGATGIEIVPRNELDLQIGDVISYEVDWTDGLVCHRIIDIGYDSEGWYAIAKGDNVSYADPGKIRFEQIKYVLVGVLY